jgi:hypothetical protein
MAPIAHYESDDSNKSAPIVVVSYLLINVNSKNFQIFIQTPQKKTFKNNASTQIRIPEFQSSPGRHLRSETNMENNCTQSIISGAMQKEQNDLEKQHRIRLEKKRESARSSQINETDDQRQHRRENETERSRSSRTDDTEEQRQKRLENDRERTRSSRTNETEEQCHIRLEQQRKRSQANRAKKKLAKRASDNTAI